MDRGLEIVLKALGERIRFLEIDCEIKDSRIEQLEKQLAEKGEEKED